MEWIASPANSVNRRSLERKAIESGHVASIVEYLPGTRFSHTRHLVSRGVSSLVKLNQFDGNDLKSVRADTTQAEWLPGIGQMEILSLHSFNQENVVLLRWNGPDNYHPHGHFGGEEGV